MLFVNRRARKLNAQGHSHWFVQPRCEMLEEKVLMAIDLGGTLPNINPNITTAPFGIDVGGPPPTLPAIAPPGAGFSVADVGNVSTAFPYDDFVIGAPTVGATPNLLGSGTGAAAYLLFGSQQLTATKGVTALSDWIAKTNNTFNYLPNDRVADLNQITPTTATTQLNPITGTAINFPYPMVEFVDRADAQSMLGASVAGLRVNGQGAILIGAPAPTPPAGQQTPGPAKPSWSGETSPA